VKDENVEQAMSNLREQQGHADPGRRTAVPRRRITSRPTCTSSSTATSSRISTTPSWSPGPARIGGIEVADFDKQIEGAKPGEDAKRSPPRAPDNHPTEAIRGKDVQIEISVKDIKRLEAGRDHTGISAGPGLQHRAGTSRRPWREQMVERIDYDVAPGPARSR